MILSEKKKIALLFTLGCRLNTADSALLTDRLQRAGYTVVDAAEPGAAPDLILINSCTVTAEAARKSRQMARQFRRRFPLARLVATGCSAELDRDVWLADGAADAVISNPAKRELAALTGEAEIPEARQAAPSLREPTAAFREEAAGSFPFRSRAFLKIQEGCGNFCTYCIVPYARGPERSRAYDEVMADCRQALAAGFAELVLTGVNTAAYQDAGRDLAQLVHDVAALPGDFRIRLSSTEPHPANLRLLEAMAAEPKVCRFLHLSLQHGADRILQRMNRHYSCADFAAFVRKARELIPGISLGTDLIVGFPGETEEDHRAGVEFVRGMDFANTHIFSYSPRPGTPAADFPDRVDPESAKRRYREHKAIADAARKRFIRTQLAGELPVIFEEERADHFLYGWSDNYIQLRLPAGEAELDRIVRRRFREEDVPELL